VNIYSQKYGLPEENDDDICKSPMSDGGTLAGYSAHPLAGLDEHTAIHSEAVAKILRPKRPGLQGLMQENRHQPTSDLMVLGLQVGSLILEASFIQIRLATNATNLR
jgi:hypothetical protein